MVEYNEVDVSFADDEPFDDPFEWFDVWWEAAGSLDIKYPNAMTVATADEGGQPHARTVLLKEWDRNGFVFYTNYRSTKGRDLSANPRAALQVYWRGLDRQFRLEGTVERLQKEASDAYCAGRPRGSQIGAWSSDQSQPIGSREELMGRYRQFEDRFEGEEVPRPPHWGGYRIVPGRFVFWRAGEFRLHDRWAFEADGTDWQRQRLNP